MEQPLREDNRLDDLPMTPVECQRCRAAVRVRKASWQQTSIQWDERSARMCLERPAGAVVPVTSDRFPTCGALRDAIARSAVSGDLAVAQPEF